jgi:hypothetical protein
VTHHPGHRTRRREFARLAALAVVSLVGTLAASAQGEGPLLRVVCFVPADRKPISGYPERIERVMREVQGFYRRGMEQAGFGSLTFPLDEDAGLKVLDRKSVV